MPKRSIVIILASLESGGAQKVTISLFNKLNTDYKIYYFVLDKKNPYLKDEVSANHSVTFLETTRDSVFIKILKTSKFIRKIKPDLLYSTMNKTNQIGLLAKILSLSKSPFIIREANFLSLKYPNESKFKKALLRYLYNKIASKIIVISNEMERDLVKNFGIYKDKMALIHNPLDFNLIEEKLSRKPNPMPKKVFNLLVVGRLVQQKNFRFVIHAIDELKVSMPNVYLTILGDGPELADLRNLVKELNLTKYVLFKGLTDNPYPYYKNADIFVSSSLWEGFPNSLLEAMACQSCVISFDCKSGPKEILTNKLNHLLVPINDSEKFNNLVLELYNNKELLARFSHLCYERAKEFSIDKVFYKFDELIKEQVKLKYCD